jgi:ubiquinone/menaquinone biosynthesis C-methylase UbiE
VRDRKEGTNVYFSVRQDMPAVARELFKSVQARSPELPESKGDKERLEACRRRRARRSRSYFESVAGDWERICRSFFADRVTSLAIEKLLPRNLVLADVGCGTGSLTFELARFAHKVIGIDLSKEMLRRAREVVKEKAIRNVEFRHADALKLPLGSRSVDALFCVMVLHFLPDPERAIAEFRRVTRPGGSVILVDLVQHSQEWMREQMAHRWLGFDRRSIDAWFRAAGVKTVDYDLTGSYAGEKMARNGNRPAEIFVARACLPTDATRNRTRKAKG